MHQCLHWHKWLRSRLFYLMCNVLWNESLACESLVYFTYKAYKTNGKLGLSEQVFTVMSKLYYIKGGLKSTVETSSLSNVEPGICSSTQGHWRMKEHTVCATVLNLYIFSMFWTDFTVIHSVLKFTVLLICTLRFQYVICCYIWETTDENYFKYRARL